MLGSDSETASAPMEGEASFCLSKRGFQLRPPSVVFHTPSATKRSDEAIGERLPWALVFLIVLLGGSGSSGHRLRSLLLFFSGFLRLLFLSKCRCDQHGE